MSTAALISGICWTFVYILTVYRGFKDKSYGMPLVALALNLTWEFTYSFIYPPNDAGIGLTIINTVWCLLDVVILFTFLKNGYKHMSESYTFTKPVFYLVTAVGFVLSFLFMYVSGPFFKDLPYFNGQIFEVGKFIAHYQNVVMGALFVHMFYMRKKNGHGASGLSLYAAIFKMLGTSLTVGITQLFSHPGNWYMIAIAEAANLIFDSWYVILLYKELKAEGVSPWKRL